MNRAVIVALPLLLAACQSQPRHATGPDLDATAASLNALQARVEIGAHNIANAQTIAYKATRVILADLPYTDRTLIDGRGQTTNTLIGAGVYIARTTTDMSQGPAIQTARQLDLFIDGPGFLSATSTERDTGRAYTRSGQLALDSDGQLVLLTRRDMRIEPGISVPCDATQIHVSPGGRITVLRPGSAEPEEIGQLQLTCFIDPESLKPVGSELYVETSESGPPLEGDPGTDHRGSVRQGMLEGSNVNLIAEQIQVQRASQQFETLSRLTFPLSPSWAAR